MALSFSSFSRFFLAGLGCLLGALPATAQQSSSYPSSTPVVPAPRGSNALYIWTGANFTNSYAGGYAGFVAALNGNLLSNGVIFRVEGSAGRYRYNSIAFPNIHVDTGGAAALVGYRTAMGPGWLTGYIGGVFETHRNPDPTAPLDGTEGGAKTIIEYFGSPTRDFRVFGQASYSTVYSTYSAFGRLGYGVISDKVWIGPEGSVYGNDAPYRHGRVGAFLGFDTSFGEVTFSGGYQKPWTTDAPDGYYATIHLGFALR